MDKLLRQRKWLFLVSSLLIVLPFEILSFFSIHLPVWFELPLFVFIIVAVGRKVFLRGIKSLLRLNFADINLLMTIAVFGALYIREFEEAAIVVILFALSEKLEDLGIERSKNALEELVNKTPKTVYLLGKASKISIEEVQIDDIAIIKPGDIIPLDGAITKGDSLVDESTITGEPLPKNKHVGDTVYAGTHNGHGYLEMKVTKQAKDTTLAKIVDLTYSSIEKKSQAQHFIEIFAQYYTPVIMIVAIGLVVVPVFVFKQPFMHWFTEALTLLLIACPCALVISTPITIFSAIGNATKKGVLIKGGKFIEELGKLKAIAFDKTRTLTKGEPVVADIVPFNGVTKEELLECIAGIEELSEHPVAKSIVAKAKEAKLKPHEFAQFQAVMGKGIKGNCTVCVDKHHCVGSLKFITEEHNVGLDVVRKVEEFEKQGKTTIVISDHKKVSGVVSIVDEIREESKSTVEILKKMGVTPVMLTGDNKSSAEYVASLLGIQIVYAELLPEDKMEKVKMLEKKYRHVGMIGDGVNDAPALATASVGIAMGAIGSDLAVENADIALMNTNLSVLPYLIDLGKRSISTIQFNTALAIIVKFVFLLLALAGRSTIAAAIFADVGVTLLVILNSLQLFQTKALPSSLSSS